MNLPFSVYDIMNSPVDTFSEMLGRPGLTPEQSQICRDIRRRGKNKIAAQNCRKRKLEQVTALERDLRLARDRKEKILTERVQLLRRRQEMVAKLGRLEKNILCKMGKEDFAITVDDNSHVNIKRRIISY